MPAKQSQDRTESSVFLSNPGDQIYDEEQSYTINITANPSARIFVSGMPPGMLWDEAERRFDFRPDFIQGGKSWLVTMEAINNGNAATEFFTVTVNNNIQPPWPEVIGSENLTGLTKLTVLQVTDDFLDSPGYAGRDFIANLAVPTAASATNLLPARIGLHGFGGSPGTVGRAWIFGVAPHDSNNTWWTGYNDQHPNGDTSQGTVPNYTQRRVMHLLSYLIEHHPGIDLERVSVSGQSMGGTGSYFLALRYARHFSYISSALGGTSSQLLSNGQQAMLRNHWGSDIPGLPNDVGVNVWESYDSSLGMLNNHDFRKLHFSTVVGQNDSTINFRHIVGPSPVTGISFIDALQQKAVGHYIVWDQRAHGGTEGPPLGANWWEPLDDTSALIRNQAFPVFTNTSADDDPGTADGLGGFTGRLRGVINRYQRWDGVNIVDTREQFSLPVKVDIDTSGTPPDPEYPPRDNYYYGPTPIINDVTIRRFQNFQLLAGEAINWEYNGTSGVVFTNDDGSVTVPNLAMMATYTELKLFRTLEPVSPSITTQPLSQSVGEGDSVTFSVVAVGSSTLSFQWFRNNEAISGATSANYTVESVSLVDEAIYHCEVSNSLGSEISDDVTLTVTPDTAAPMINGAIVRNQNIVDIQFNEAVAASGAETVANYQVSAGLQVVSATLNFDNKTVHLQTDQIEPDTVYTVWISNIQDTSAAANTIIPESSVDIVYAPVISFDNGLLPLDWTPLTLSRWSVVTESGNNVLFLNTTDYPPLSGNRLGEHIISPGSYSDFSLSVEAKTNESPGNANADYALVFGYQDGDNYYYMLFNRTQNNTQLFKVVGGIREVLATATANWLTDDEYHTVEVQRVFDTIEIKYDNSTVVQVVDSTYISGKLGLGSYNDSVYFDDIRISTTANSIPDLIFTNTFE